MRMGTLFSTVAVGALVVLTLGSEAKALDQKDFWGKTALSLAKEKKQGVLQLRGVDYYSKAVAGLCVRA